MDAREYFQAVRDSAKIISEYDLTIEREMAEAEFKAKSGDTRHVKGTPTDPMRHIDKAIDMQSVRTETLDSAKAQVEQGKIICTHVSTMLGQMYGDVLKMRYIELMTWWKIADALKITKTHAEKVADVAIDWIDCEGIARIKEGVSKWTSAI